MMSMILFISLFLFLILTVLYFIVLVTHYFLEMKILHGKVSFDFQFIPLFWDYVFYTLYTIYFRKKVEL